MKRVSSLISGNKNALANKASCLSLQGNKVESAVCVGRTPIWILL